MSNTYLRDVLKYQIKMFLDRDDYYVCVKKHISAQEKFILKNGICVMDNGYYVLVVVSKVLNYAMRLFLDDKKNPLEYYFDISKNICLYENTNVPCYGDLYLDITYMNGVIEVVDEDELMDVYKDGIYLL